VVRFDREAKSSIEKETHQQIYAYVKQQVLDGLDAIVLSDYCKGVVTKGLVRDIVTLAKKHKVVVSVDPKISHFGIYSGVTILTRTPKKHRWLQDRYHDEKSCSGGKQLLSRLKCNGAHHRSDRARAFSGKGSPIPTIAEVYDVTGASDTVIMCHPAWRPVQIPICAVVEGAAGIVSALPDTTVGLELNEDHRRCFSEASKGKMKPKHP
jgi:D-beta-D-heptose 7-phosphate kinase/D-beta-D-heptose 1-phosphate adenosyltransferase